MSLPRVVLPPGYTQSRSTSATKTAMNASSAKQALWRAIFAGGVAGAAQVVRPGPARTQFPPPPSSVRAQRPTSLGPRSELGTSSTMLRHRLVTEEMHRCLNQAGGCLALLHAEEEGG